MSLKAQTTVQTVWVEYLDAKRNKPYYYNRETKETSWAMPPEYKRWKDHHALSSSGNGSNRSSSGSSSSSSNSGSSSSTSSTLTGKSSNVARFEAFMKSASSENLLKIDAFLKTTSWRRAKNNDGRTYYFEKETKLTQWHEPTVLVDFLAEMVRNKDEQAQAAAAGTAAKPASGQGATIIKKRKVADMEFDVVVDAAQVPVLPVKKQAAVDEEDLTFGDEHEGDDDFGVDEDEQDEDGEKERGGDGAEEEEEEEEEEDAEEEEYAGDEFGESGATPQFGHADSSPMYDDYYGDVMDTNQGKQPDAQGLMEAPAIETEAAEVARLEAQLSQRDAVMDPASIVAAKRIFHLTRDAERIIKRMAEGYCGFPQMTRIVGEWLALAKSLSGGAADGGDKPLAAGAATFSSSSSFSSFSSFFSSSAAGQPAPTSSSDTATTESIAVEFLAASVKQHFDETLADQLLSKAHEAQWARTETWIKGLMGDPVYRRMLIELYDQHSDSTLLGYCIREISQMGHHREIAAVIRESEYFTVFNNLLVDMLTRMSRSNASEVVLLTEDLKRSCCSSEYMFLYANRLFLQVEQNLADELEEVRNKAARGGQDESYFQNLAEIYSGLRCKVRRLRQELEGAAIWTDLTDGVRLNATSQFALCLSGIYAPASAPTANSSAEAVVVFELADLLRTNEMSAGHAQRLCQQYLSLSSKEDVDSANVTAEHLRSLPAPLHLLRHPQVLKLSVDALIHPLRSMGSPARVATLLALACVHDDGSSDLVGMVTQARRQGGPAPMDAATLEARAQEVATLRADLLTACTLCGDIIRMAYGNADYDKALQLVELVRQPCVSMAVIRWMDYHVTSGPLVSSAALLTVLPIFFQLLVAAIERHPLQRPDSFAVLRAVLSISSLASSNDDSSSKHFAWGVRENYTIMNVHEDCLECITVLMGSGFCVIPMQFLLSKVEVFDIALLRRTLRLLLSSARPPFSKAFAPMLYSFTHKSLVALAKQRWTRDEVAIFSDFRWAVADEEEDLFEVPDADKASTLESIDVIIAPALKGAL